MVALRQDGLRQIRGIVIKVMFARSCRLSRAVKRADKSRRALGLRTETRHSGRSG